METAKGAAEDMAEISRREFCFRSGLSIAALAGARSVFAQDPHKKRAGMVDVASIDRQRILTAANRYLHEQPVTITAASSPRSAGGKHDYFSEGDYWWPDPKNPNGPYIQRDGMSNPENFTAHRHALIRLSVRMPALTAAWVLTHQKQYAAQAARHLRAWFLDPATRMNPNLQYAQAIKGRTTGRGTGVIDTLHLVEVARAIPFLTESKTLSDGEQQGLKQWFADYLTWMTTSKNGQEERDAKNNHGTCWVLQAAAFASYTGNHELASYCRSRFKSVLVPGQIAQNGSFPLELRRTKPYSYCLFNLDVMSGICQALSSAEDNLFTYELADGRGFGKAIAFMFPFIANKTSWPYPPDVEYFNDLPVRQPSLLFGGLALSRPEYIELWRTLNPDPTVEEIIRNYPIRQPLLWVTPGAKS